MLMLWFWPSREYYEPQSLLLCEEAAIVAGLLVGLNVVDCTITVKGDDLDQPVCACQ